MPYEILLSDTARADLDQIAGPPLERTRALLAAIAESADPDHVLTAASTGFELRYRSLDSTYVFFRRNEDRVTVLYFCEMVVEQAGTILQNEPSHRILDWSTRDIPSGMEAQSTVEFTYPDGATRVQRQFTRKVDLGETYTVFHHQAVTGRPPFTSIVQAQKGAIDGDFRHDQIEMLVLHPDGRVERFPAREVPVWIKNPLAGLSPEEMLDRMRGWAKDRLPPGMPPEDFLRSARRWKDLG